MVSISVPQVNFFTWTVHVFTAKRLDPRAQGRGASPRTLGKRVVHRASVEPKIMSHTRVFRDRNARRHAWE
jgi:hypothetical protein